MCRNIKTLYNFDPPAHDEEVRAASLQFVRKISGFTAVAGQLRVRARRGRGDGLGAAAARWADHDRRTQGPRDRGGQGATAGGAAVRDGARLTRPSGRFLRLLPLLAVLALVAWVHRRSLFAFFSSPDDLRHLQQALGLRPTQVTPFRVLSQVLYFRAMARGRARSLPYHLVTCGCHLLNVVLAYRLFRSWQVPRSIAGVAVTLFGAMPLSQTLLSSAVGINDELSLALGLTALLLWSRPSWPARFGAPVVYALALLCKELVLFLPAVLLIARPGGITVRAQARRLLPFAAVAAGAAIGFFQLRAHGLATDREEYAMAFGPNLFHNLMTFTAWATDLVHAMPDLISTYNVHAWRWAMVVYAFVALAAWQVPAQRGTIAIGLAWWVLALIPVLPLATHTYRHYFYAALPGLALAVTAAAAGLLARFATERGDASHVRDTRPAAVTAAVLVAFSVVYAVRADQQIERRARAHIAGVDLALDPVLRRQEVAGRALGSIARSLDAGSRRLAIRARSGAPA
jgi:hypothetical protein